MANLLGMGIVCYGPRISKAKFMFIYFYVKFTLWIVTSSCVFIFAGLKKSSYLLNIGPLGRHQYHQRSRSFGVSLGRRWMISWVIAVAASFWTSAALRTLRTATFNPACLGNPFSEDGWSLQTCGPICVRLWGFLWLSRYLTMCREIYLFKSTFLWLLPHLFDQKLMRWHLLSGNLT